MPMICCACRWWYNRLPSQTDHPLTHRPRRISLDLIWHSEHLDSPKVGHLCFGVVLSRSWWKLKLKLKRQGLLTLTRKRGVHVRRTSLCNNRWKSFKQGLKDSWLALKRVSKLWYLPQRILSTNNAGGLISIFLFGKIKGKFTKKTVWVLLDLTIVRSFCLVVKSHVI